MDINNRLIALRKVMASEGIDAIVVPSSDPHQSEYVADHWQERVWISGFTGSAGTVVVTADHAGLWTDSRYFLQAEQELAGSSFVLHKMYNQFAAPYIDFIAENLPSGSTVVVNGFMFSKASIDNMTKVLQQSNIRLIYRKDLISDIWKDRPSLSKSPIEIHDQKLSGKSVAEKLVEINQKMAAQKADYHLITALDDLAWSFNIRGKDVECNPVAIAYAVIGHDGAHIFIDSEKLTSDVKNHFSQNHILVHRYEEITQFLNELPETASILVDPNICSQNIYEAINANIIQDQSIPKILKAIKNDIEIGHIREVMKKDGAALATTFKWLEEKMASGEGITEVQLAQKLIENRSAQSHYQNESFSAIVGYRSNGAIIHYHPVKETCKTIYPEGILLVDSGGQYSDGTTDITRTFALSTPTQQQQASYTLILKGMIALSMAKFPEGTVGGQLDTLARQFLWSEGLNYGHGTGHGVGFYLNVHEPPQGFAPYTSERGRTVIVPGMLTSNEPGHYVEGEYGMRIENLIVSKKSSYLGFLDFETVTVYPFDHSLIDKNRLTDAEIHWINEYHEMSYNGISPYLEGDLKDWFKEKCKPL